MYGLHGSQERDSSLRERSYLRVIVRYTRRRLKRFSSPFAYMRVQ